MLCFNTSREEWHSVSCTWLGMCKNVCDVRCVLAAWGQMGDHSRLLCHLSLLWEFTEWGTILNVLTFPNYFLHCKQKKPLKITFDRSLVCMYIYLMCSCCEKILLVEEWVALLLLRGEVLEKGLLLSAECVCILN